MDYSVSRGLNCLTLVLRGVRRKGGRCMEGELTHVTSIETKKRRATLVYPYAALFASTAALLF